ncbi:hypothetical protein EJB05_10016, partial [Eragrostis curvula]
MDGIVASASKGVIDSVLAKLKVLIMGDMCIANLLGVSRTGICFLWDELSAMNALLEKLEDADDLDPQAKNWRNQVREITYDIEDWIDEFTSSERNDDAKAGFISRISQFLETLRSRVKAAEQIKDLKTRLQEINERYKRYKIGEYSPYETTKVDSRLPALYKESTSLVGIENSKEELIGVIDKANEFKVVSIVGFGGLGKTTLANEVYREVRRRYDRTAFVSISQKPDVARILKSILSQLGPNIYSHHCEVQDLINNLREHLHDKRSEMTMDLSGMDQLTQLRYVKAKSGGLRHLETLELPALSVCCIPPDVVHLPCLSHLVVPHDTELPDGIGKVKSLRTMDGFDLSRSSLENISAIGELTNLRNLSLHCHTESWEYASALGGSLEKLSKNLKRLSVSCTFVGSCADALDYPLRSLGNLELLDVSGCTFDPSSSSWLGYKLNQLRVLRLGLWQIQHEDIDIIGTLGSLVQLHLRTPSALTERIVITRSTGFARLKVFELECDGISRLTFEAGAMPSLRKLWLSFDPNAWDKATPVGLQHLSSLKEIYVLTVRNSSTAAAVSEAPSTSMSETAVIRGAFQEVADAHPGRPEFTLGEAWLIR